MTATLIVNWYAWPDGTTSNVPPPMYVSFVWYGTTMPVYLNGELRGYGGIIIKETV